MSRPAPPPPDRLGPAQPRRDPRNPWAPTAFARLARTHAAGVAGDAVFAIGLAGSVFFSLDFDSARWRVALYLVLTIAPFAIAAPLIGPALDRIKGGRRWIITGSMALRAVLALTVVRYLDDLWFYPAAFGMLVLGKVYTISKSAVVPGTVRNDTELVEANSKLTVLSAVVVVIAAAPAGALLALGGSRWSLGLSAILFVVATVFALRLQPTVVADEPVGEAEKEELRSAGIFLAGTAMSLVRGVVGFLAFMLAFAFKDAGAPLWQLGVVAATAQIGFFVGAVIAPRLRRLANEEQILVGALVIIAVGGLATAVIGGLFGAAVMSMLVGATGSSAKQAFDAILQRDAPDANRGRSFARFETRFQLIWVIGALVPIVVPVSAQVGFALIAVAASITAGWYLLELRRIRQGNVPVRRRGWKLRPLFGPGVRSPHPLTPEPEPDSDGESDGDQVAATATADHDRRPAPPTPAPPTPAPPDPTLVDGDATTVRRGFAVDPPWASRSSTASRPGADVTTVTDAPPPPDRARRWMRRAPEPDAGPSGGTGAAPPEVCGQGMLFGPEAWDEAVPSDDAVRGDEAAPADADEAPPSP
ncbi:MFS transporter [Rhabdothermincola salaria]|uniref:MFS transporter n=1 Tax=Rhabdothermincola salaria TaxID=2903142 RepID=UPI001E55F4A0|nr:MFS transporter [Rhabdothermincola salaria]